MLSAKWNSYDGNAQEDAKHQMGKTNPDTSQENPKNIHDDTQTASRLRRSLNAFAKRAESQEAQFQSLDTKWNADDGYHHSQTGDYVLYSGNNATK